MDDVWDIKKIQEVLPQKYPFLFIDKVLEINKKEGKVTCLKNVTINDYFFEGHFPGNPIMPGAIIIEAMAQVGDQLILEIHREKFLNSAGIVKALAKVKNEIVAEAKIVFGVKIKT
jgi:3-hydroxyacyl-[acyl-carrier-protein] dehydratase